MRRTNQRGFYVLLVMAVSCLYVMLLDTSLSCRRLQGQGVAFRAKVLREPPVAEGKSGVIDRQLQHKETTSIELRRMIAKSMICLKP